MLRQLRDKIDHFLFKRKMTSAAARHLLCTQVIITLASFVLAIPLMLLTRWPLYFAIGAALATFNLWQIIRMTQMALLSQYSAKISAIYFLGFTLRIMLAAIVLFWFIAVQKVSIIPLVAGLTSSLLAIIAWGVTRSNKKTAEEA